MSAKQFKSWCMARGARCLIRPEGGEWVANLHVPDTPREAEARAPELEDAVRQAQLLFDMAYATKFPCPECGKPVLDIRAARTERGWIIESATGVGSLQACCRAADLLFPDMKEAVWYARAIEQWARSETR